MFLIEIKNIAFRYQCCCVIIFAETTKPHIQAYEILEDITSIIACQEKSYAFPMPFAVTALNDRTATLIAKGYRFDFNKKH